MVSSEDKIIAAAIHHFSKKGYAATSIRDIANEANLASSALYYYVNNKQKLLVLIMEKYLKELISLAYDRVNAHNSPKNKLQELVHLHVELHGREQLVALVVDTEYRSLESEGRETIRKLRKEYEVFWQRILSDGVEQGIFQIQNVKMVSYALLAMCTGVVHWFSPDKDQTITEVGNHYAEMALGLVRAQ